MPDDASTLPAPMTPPDLDLQDFGWMPLHVSRLRDSDMAREESPEACWAAVLLWSAAWHQVPAASLPDNDRVLAGLAGYGRDLQGWAQVRAGALRNFERCADGRLYHPVVAVKALEAWIEKLAARIRSRKGVAKRTGSELNKSELAALQVTLQRVQAVLDQALQARAAPRWVALAGVDQVVPAGAADLRSTASTTCGQPQVALAVDQGTGTETIQGADYPRVCARAGVVPVDNPGASPPSGDGPGDNSPGGAGVPPAAAAAPAPAVPCHAAAALQAVPVAADWPAPTPAPPPRPATAWPPPLELYVEPALCGPPDDLDPQLEAQIAGRPRTAAGEVCCRLRLAGLPDPDPADPALAELLALGVGVDELLPLVDRAATKAHPFAWLLVTAISRRQDAARLRDTLPRDAPAALARASPAHQPWWETRSGITARGVELGVGDWSEDDWIAGRTGDFLAYRARVYLAAGPGPWSARAQH